MLGRVTARTSLTCTPLRCTTTLLSTRRYLSTPAEDAAAKMNFGPKSTKAGVTPKANNVKQFNIYRWNPDTKGNTKQKKRRRRKHVLFSISNSVSEKKKITDYLKNIVFLFFTDI